MELEVLKGDWDVSQSYVTSHSSWVVYDTEHAFNVMKSGKGRVRIIKMEI